VRDALLRLEHLDWDLATAATPDDIRRTFRRTVPVGERFGTIGVFGSDGRLHEVTTFRRDVRTDGRHAEVEFGVSLDEDLARRDFTINAIAWSPSRRVVHDPFGGREDLGRRVVRAVGVAADRMREDRLRALRALRFAGRFGFAIEPGTWQAIVQSAPALPRLSRERVQQELVKTLQQVARPSDGLLLWKTSGALRELIPALDAQPEWRLHGADCVAQPDATREAGRAQRRLHIRLGAILSGLDGATVGAVLRDLRFARRDVDRLSHVAVKAEQVRTWVGTLRDGAAPVALRQLAADIGRMDVADTLRVARAAQLASPNDVSSGRQWSSLYRAAVRCAFRDPVELSDLALDGDDLLREGGVPPGPMIGRVLHQLLAWVLEDPARNRRDVLLTHARTLT
jgi:tRNA nucleotidyltransferase (CCA-adding enzyme)